MIIAYLFVALVLFLQLRESRKNKRAFIKMIDVADSLTGIITDIEYENQMVLRKVKKTFGIKHYRVSNIKAAVRKELTEKRMEKYLKNLENVN